MSILKLVISDLHIADGHPILDCFGDSQQSALEGLLKAASPNGPLGNADDVELIINGDCFDFLTTPPYDTGGTIDALLAFEKLEKIISAHHPFFEALRAFINLPGRHLTFITGNHDIELCFTEIRARICKTLGVSYNETTVHFCPARSYRPLADVYIEHGNHYDFWNHCTNGLWDTQGQALTRSPQSITLPIGSYYWQHGAHPTSIQYPYFDHFEPSMNTIRQIALMCLLNPKIVIETAQHTMEMLSEPRKGLSNLAPGEERIPAKIFEQAMLDFAVFQQDMVARKPDWTDPSGAEENQERANAIMEFASIYETLTLPPLEAVAALCTPTTYQMGESVAIGMHNVLRTDPTLRYAIAGHTHMLRSDPIKSDTRAQQVYLNTASWTTRVALPAPGEITPELARWLYQPDWAHIPLRDVTQLIFAVVHATSDGPSNASLCVWEGDNKGFYRILA